MEILLIILPIIIKVLPELEKLIRMLVEAMKEMEPGQEFDVSSAAARLGIDPDAMERCAGILQDITTWHPDWSDQQRREYTRDALETYLVNIGRPDLVTQGVPELLLGLNDVAKKLKP